MINFGFGVVLTKITSQDLIKLFQWRNDPRIWKWCRQNDALSWDSHLTWYQKQAQDPSIKMYSIISDTGDFVGCCGFTSFDLINRKAEFSLYIDPDIHKSGLGEKALKTLVTHGFENLGLHRIWGESYDGNPAIGLFERLGFKKEGSNRQSYFREGRYIDAHLFGILRHECVYLPTLGVPLGRLMGLRTPPGDWTDRPSPPDSA